MKNVVLALGIIFIGFVLPAQAGDGKKILIIASNLEDMGDSDKHDPYHQN